MKLFILFAWLTFEAQAFSDHWFTCTQTNECTKIHVGCGRAGGVNKKFESDFKEVVRKNAELSSCLQPSKSDLENDKLKVPTCLYGKCEIILPKKS